MKMFTMPLCDIFSVLLILLQIRGSISTSCSIPERTKDPQQCITDIRSMVQDKDEFWFGNDYSRRCPGGPFSSVDCYNTIPLKPYSLISRIFRDHPVDVSLIDRFITMEYTTETGKTYQGCGHTLKESSSSRTFDIDPLASRHVYHPLETKLEPMIKWDKVQGELYTVWIYDAGSHIAHVIHINDMEVIKPYSGPLNPVARPNIYACLLFKQNGFINLTAEWRAKLANPMISYNMSDAVAALGLEGPIAVNVLRVSADVYSTQRFVDIRVMNNCPYFVTQALQQHKRSFVPNDLTLSVMMYVTFNSSPVVFGSCCKMYSFPEKNDITFDPIGNGMKKTYEVRTGSTIKVRLEKRTQFPMATNFNGTLYTLLVVDPDVPSDSAGTPDKPLLHWMVVNIPNGQVTDGREIKSYIGPAPPDGDHTYYFLLYEQSSSIDPSTFDVTFYTGPNCSPGIAGRCRFDLYRFETGNNVKLVGATWFVATRDEYVRHLHSIRSNSDIPTICQGTPGYTPECKTGTGNKNNFSFNVLISLLILLICLV